MKVSAKRRIPARQDRVFEALIDFHNAPKRVSAIKRCEVLTDGPIGKGTRFRETRVVFGREATETMEIVEFEPPRSFTLLAQSCGCRYVAKMSCTAHGNETEVEMSLHAQPLTFMAKLFSPLAVLMSKACRKAFEKDLEDLERSLQGPVEGAKVPMPAV